jgi:glycosyltransferase involved in cell wall biosynthesis
LQNAIEVLIKDNKKRQLFGEKSLEKIRKEFDTKYIVNQYIKIYKDIM